MMSVVKDPLFILIKSLSKSEKRQFKLYVNRLGTNSDAKFLALFNHFDKTKEYDEDEILKSGIVKKEQISNLKANLYKQILVSIRLSPGNQNIRIHLREQLDFATILYSKGLYKQSLKILDKAKIQALENEEKVIAFEIIELEKIIESQYITRSISGRADELTIQAKEISQQNVVASKLSNLSLQLYGTLLKTGYVKSDREHQLVRDYFTARLEKIKIGELKFREKLWFYQAHLWYSFLVQDFLACYKYANRWVDLFYENPQMISFHPVFFLKGNHYLLESLFYLRYHSQFELSLKKLEETTTDESFPKNDNLEMLAFQYRYNNKINLYFLKGTFEDGLSTIPEILEGIKKFKDKMDDHHVMVFYYKIACLYFGAGDNLNCINYLGKIINDKNLTMREDLLCFSRLLNLIAHYDEGLDVDFEMELKRTYKFLLKMNDLHEVQKEIIKFLRRIMDVYPSDIRNEFIKLHKTLKSFENDPYERRAFLYLDFISWLESKIENKPVGFIIREKAKYNLR